MTQIPFTEIDSIPCLVKDFLNQKLADFSENLFNISHIERKIEEKKTNFPKEKREILHRVLAKQYSGFDLSEKQKINLEFLLAENTYTIVTGHQLNLFTGPSFFVYKILQTIKTAKFLSEKLPHHHFVPIFWLASEDHDFEEINHFKTPFHHYEIKGKSGGAVGRIRVEDDFFISEFEKEFQDFPFGTELILRLKEAYKKGNTLAQATKTLAQWLFADYGLLCIDGDDEVLKSQMKEIFRDEILHQSLFHQTKNRVQSLAETYGKVQVNPREINLFNLSEKRNRIDFKNDNYPILDTEISFSKEEILEKLDQHPQHFSPNAVMRPIYQETILPNLAYIGGNAEVAYWLELKDYFQYLNLPFPVLIPRNSMLFLSEKTMRKIETLGLKIEDFFGNFSKVIERELLKNQPLEGILEQKKMLIEQIFNNLREQSALTDVTFKNLVEAEKTRQLKSFKRMEKRLLRAEKIKQKELLERLEKLFYDIHPAKNWQERVYNFSIFYAEEGKAWLQSCYDRMDVEHSVLIVSRF